MEEDIEVRMWDVIEMLQERAKRIKLNPLWKMTHGTSRGRKF